MEKKMVLLVGCLVVALLLCGAPQVVVASEHPEDHDQELVMDSDAGEPEFDEEEENDGDDDFDQDEEVGEEEGDDEEEGSGEDY